MKVKLLLIFLFVFTMRFLSAQEAVPEILSNDSLTKIVNKLEKDMDFWNHLLITGYIQPQYQHIDSAGAASFAAGNFAPNTNSRFMMRRGRVKFTYEHGNAMYMLNTDWTEKGANIRETYVRVTDPWTKWLSLTAGLHQNRFGHDISYSSGSREMPERARMFQTLFPTERDLQAFITVQAPKTSKWNFIKGEFAVMNGAGVASEFDSHKDLCGRLSLNSTNKSGNIKYGVGISYLSGAWTQNRGKGTSFNKKAVYTNTVSNGEKGYSANYADTGNANALVKREYLGIDVQFSIDWKPGITTVRAEYIQGQQPGTSTSSTSFGVAPTSDIFIRNFNGASFYFIQNILNSKHQLAFRYDWYDPNTRISGDGIGKTGTNTKAGDIKYTTIGFGWNYFVAKNVKMTFFYDMVTNEITQVSGFTKDLKDNVFTVRMQYKFGG